MGEWYQKYHEIPNFKVLAEGHRVLLATNTYQKRIKDLRLVKKRKDMVALGEEIRKQYDTSFCKLQSSGRMPACVKAREVMFWIAAKELGFSEAGDALYLGA